jgi:hypothetical protein
MRSTEQEIEVAEAKLKTLKGRIQKIQEEIEGFDELLNG